MRKAIITTLALVAGACLAAVSLHAADSVTKEGSMSCGKCNLSVADKCSDVLEVKEEDATVRYWLEEEGKAKTSKHVCSGSAPMKVTGTLSERDGKKIIAVTSFE